MSEGLTEELVNPGVELSGKWVSKELLPCGEWGFRVPETEGAGVGGRSAGRRERLGGGCRGGRPARRAEISRALQLAPPPQPDLTALRAAQPASQPLPPATLPTSPRAPAGRLSPRPASPATSPAARRESPVTALQGAWPIGAAPEEAASAPPPAPRANEAPELGAATG